MYRQTDLYSRNLRLARTIFTLTIRFVILQPIVSPSRRPCIRPKIRPGSSDMATLTPPTFLYRPGGAKIRLWIDSVTSSHCVFFLVFDHLARAALWAISRRCSGESAAALASPPFFAPSLDNATACGFFFFSPMVLKSIYASSSREKQ